MTTLEDQDGVTESNPTPPRVQTHYLDWERIWTEAGAKHSGNIWTGIAGAWVPTDTGDDWVAECASFWRRGYYQAGPVESAYRLSDDEPEAFHLCEMLWARYNYDGRPDGQSRRSMSVGDVVRIGNVLYLCRGSGWSLFEAAQA